jgi:hypothetical protein
MSHKAFSIEDTSHHLHLDYNLDEIRTGSRSVSLSRSVDLDLFDGPVKAKPITVRSKSGGRGV